MKILNMTESERRSLTFSAAIAAVDEDVDVPELNLWGRDFDKYIHNNYEEFYNRDSNLCLMFCKKAKVSSCPIFKPFKDENQSKFYVVAKYYLGTHVIGEVTRERLCEIHGVKKATHESAFVGVTYIGYSGTLLGVVRMFAITHDVSQENNPKELFRIIFTKDGDFRYTPENGLEPINGVRWAYSVLNNPRYYVYIPNAWLSPVSGQPVPEGSHLYCRDDRRGNSVIYNIKVGLGYNKDDSINKRMSLMCNIPENFINVVKIYGRKNSELELFLKQKGEMYESYTNLLCAFQKKYNFIPKKLCFAMAYIFKNITKEQAKLFLGYKKEVYALETCLKIKAVDYIKNHNSAFDIFSKLYVSGSVNKTVLEHVYERDHIFFNAERVFSVLKENRPLAFRLGEKANGDRLTRFNMWDDRTFTRLKFYEPKVKSDLYRIEARFGKITEDMFQIPSCEISENGRRIYIMPFSEVSKMTTIGYETKCCQHLRGAGETAMLYGLYNPNGGFMRLTNEADDTRAQAEIWELDEDTLVLDNIEYTDDSAVSHYGNIIRKWVEKLNYKNVIMGLGYNSEVRYNTEDYLSGLEPPKYEGQDYTPYTDTSESVYLKRDGVISSTLREWRTI